MMSIGFNDYLLKQMANNWMAIKRHFYLAHSDLKQKVDVSFLEQ